MDVTTMTQSFEEEAKTTTVDSLKEDITTTVDPLNVNTATTTTNTTITTTTTSSPEETETKVFFEDVTEIQPTKTIAFTTSETQKEMVTTTAENKHFSASTKLFTSHTTLMNHTTIAKFESKSKMIVFEEVTNIEPSSISTNIKSSTSTNIKSSASANIDFSVIIIPTGTAEIKPIEIKTTEVKPIEIKTTEVKSPTDNNIATHINVVSITTHGTSTTTSKIALETEIVTNGLDIDSEPSPTTNNIGSTVTSVISSDIIKTSPSSSIKLPPSSSTKLHPSSSIKTEAENSHVPYDPFSNMVSDDNYVKPNYNTNNGYGKLNNPIDRYSSSSSIVHDKNPFIINGITSNIFMLYLIIMIYTFVRT